jgi:hypothetical protein
MPWQNAEFLPSAGRLIFHKARRLLPAHLV